MQVLSFYAVALDTLDLFYDLMLVMLNIMVLINRKLEYYLLVIIFWLNAYS